jgi:1-acyl-sn-glycerol-3-phosphate acyltransferase
MNLFTVKWFGKFFGSLIKLNPELKKIRALREGKAWQEYKPYVDEHLYNWLNPLVDMAGVDFKVSGKEKVPTDRAVIYTPNHAGAFDIPAITLNAPAPPMFMAKKELAKLPLVKNWMEVLDCVFVDRSNKSSAHSSLQDAIEKVKTGRSLVVFPEGTRSKTGELGEFRGGAMKIAMETGATIVPVLIEGSRERLEETGNVTAGTVYVTFLDPIETKGLTKEEFFEMPSKLRQIIQDERDRQRGNLDNKM